MRKIILSILIIIPFLGFGQFTGTDSLRNYNNRFITTNPATAFTNNRLNTLLRGIIDFIDTARAGGGGAITLGIDTIYAVNDSTIRYRKNGVFRQFTLKGVYESRRKVDTAYAVNDTTLRITINGLVRNIIIPGRGGSNNIAKAALTADGNYIQDWNHKWLYFNNLNSLNFISDDPDPNHPQNRKIFQMSADSTIDNYPFRILWGLKNINNDFTDSLHFELTSTKDLTYLYQYTDGGAKSLEMDWDPHAYYPSTKIYANGNSKNGYYELGASVATIQPNDSVVITGVPSTIDTTNIKPVGIGPFGKIYKLPGWPGSGGGSTTLNNVGTGLRRVTTPNGSIKTDIYGYGVNGDSTTNANTITVVADTSELVTPSDLKDTAALIRTDLSPKNLYGLIYSKASWSSIAADFVNSGADTSISGGKILLQPSGSPGTFTQSIGLKNATCLEHWRMLVRYTLKSTPASTTYGLGVGIRSTNTHVTSSVLTYTDMTTDGTNGGKVFHAVDYPTPAVLETSGGSLSKALNDQFETIIERSGDKVTVSNRNLTGNSATQATEHTYSTVTAPATELLPNTGRFSLFAIGGLIQIDSISVFSKEMKGADLAAVVDSKGLYYSKNDSSWIAQIRPSFNGVVALSGGGDRPQDIYDRKDEIIALQPKQVILECGTNESDTSVVKTYIQRINDTLTAHGIRVIHTAFYQTSPSTLWRHNYISRTFPYVIDNYNPLTQPNTINVDGIHPSQYGHITIASNTLSSGKVLYGKYYTPGTVASSGGSGSFINNGTSPQTADFNMTGTGTLSGLNVTGSAPIALTNQFGSSNDGVAFFRSTGTNKTTNLYLSPNTNGSGGNLTSFAMFNADVTTSPSNFGFASFQMKPTEFYLYTSYVGSGTLPSMKLGTGGSTFQLTLNTNGTTTVTGNAQFSNQIAVGPSFTSPFSKSLLHANRSVNDAVYNMVSNTNTGNGASAGFKANLDPTREDTNYISMMVLGANYSQPSRPTLGGGSTLLETTAPGNLYISAHNDSGKVIVTTDTSMIPRMEVTHNGAIKFGTGSNSYTFPTARASAGQVLTDVSGNGTLTWQTPSGGSSYTFGNGLTESGGAVKLGGALTQNTTITSAVSGRNITYTGISDYADGPQFKVDNTGSVGIAIHGESTDGRGIEGFATSGVGVYGLATTGNALLALTNSGSAVYAQSDDGMVLEGVIQPSSTNTAIPWGSFSRKTTGTAANGLGGYFEYKLQSSTGVDRFAGSMHVDWENATDASRSSSMYFKNTFGTVLTLNGDGSIKHNGYGAGTNTVTPATTPVYGSTGVIGERIAPKIYTATISATAGNNPTVTVLGTNEIGSIVWTRNSAGNYSGTLTGAFTSGKTWLSIQRGSGTSGFVNGWIFHSSANVINIQTQDNAASAVDSFDEISFEIRVYP